MRQSWNECVLPHELLRSSGRESSCHFTSFVHKICQRPNQSLQSIRAVVSFDLPNSVQELHAGQLVQLTDPNCQCVSCSSVAVLLQDALVPPPLRGNLDGDVQVHRPVCSKSVHHILRQIWHLAYHITAIAAARHRVAHTRTKGASWGTRAVEDPAHFHATTFCQYMVS